MIIDAADAGPQWTDSSRSRRQSFFGLCGCSIRGFLQLLGILDPGFNNFGMFAFGKVAGIERSRAGRIRNDIDAKLGKGAVERFAANEGDSGVTLVSRRDPLPRSGLMRRRSPLCALRGFSCCTGNSAGFGSIGANFGGFIGDVRALVFAFGFRYRVPGTIGIRFLLQRRQLGNPFVDVMACPLLDLLPGLT